MKKKILIVDDEPGIVRLLSLRLKANGFEVYEAFDGFQGVKIAVKEVPDLILMDTKMPIMSGITAFEHLIQMDITKNIPVVFMTASPKLEVNNQVTLMGAKGVISKPFISKDLELIIERIIDGNDFNSENRNIDQHTDHHSDN